MERYRFDRNKFMIGTYCLREYAWSEEHIQALEDAGINFICSVRPDRELLDRLERHGMGMFASGVLPGWWGGHGEKAGGLAEAVPVSSYEKVRERFADHPAIWGLDMGDEPSAVDFPHYGKLFEEMKRLFPGLVPYLNLYPKYGVLASNTEEEIIAQLGTQTYEEHIGRFVECVDSDYICYDYYMYSDTAQGAYENLRVVADQCRASGRDMWIVLQVNSFFPEKWISLEQLRHQAYTALAFGARSINWACWTAGWWHNQVLDSEGRPTQQYEKLCTVNRELHAMGGRTMRYRCESTRFIGEADDLGMFEHISAEGGRALAGHMASDEGEAMFIADCESERAYPVRFRLKEGVGIRAVLVNGQEVRPERATDGEHVVWMNPSSGLMIEAVLDGNNG